MILYIYPSALRGVCIQDREPRSVSEDVLEFSHNTQSWQYWHLIQMHQTTFKECKRINFTPKFLMYIYIRIFGEKLILLYIYIRM